ncbi:MAG: cyclase family protein [Thermodesulfobacteriota bacterium]|nr:cyclase family protein [Thermodesulfobacteriota bacterium]
MGIVEILSKGRTVELNKVLEPGKEARRLEIRRFKIFAGEFMHDIDTMSHIGTHAEAPSHFIPALYEGKEAKDIADLPAAAWWGEAVFINLAKLPAKAKISPEYLREKGVRQGDIVVIGNCPYKDDEKISMTDAAARWLAEVGIKLLAMDFSYNIEENFSELGRMTAHVELLSRGIPLIEGLAHLDQLKTERFFFIGLPCRVKGCDAWPIRALAIEGVL